MLILFVVFWNLKITQLHSMHEREHISNIVNAPVLFELSKGIDAAKSAGEYIAVRSLVRPTAIQVPFSGRENG